MHKKPEAYLLPLDIEIERTLRHLRKSTSAESKSMANQRERLQAIPEEEAETERPKGKMTMEDFWRPSIRDEYSIVRQPDIETNNFELKTALITMVQQHQFIGHPSKDPNEHMGRFMRMENIVKLKGVKLEVIRL